MRPVIIFILIIIGSINAFSQSGVDNKAPFSIGEPSSLAGQLIMSKDIEETQKIIQANLDKPQILSECNPPTKKE